MKENDVGVTERHIQNSDATHHSFKPDPVKVLGPIVPQHMGSTTWTSCTPILDIKRIFSVNINQCKVQGSNMDSKSIAEENMCRLLEEGNICSIDLKFSW